MYKKRLTSNHQMNPILIQGYPRKWGWLDLPQSNINLSNSHSPSHSIQDILLLQTNTLALLLHLHLPHYFSLVVLTSSSPSLQTPMLFSNHAHHPSSTYASTISLNSPSEPLFPSIPSSPLGPLSSFSKSVLQ